MSYHVTLRCDDCRDELGDGETRKAAEADAKQRNHDAWIKRTLQLCATCLDARRHAKTGAQAS